MGQRVGMSPSDIQQLRLLYQCSTGSRTLGELTPDNLCSPECKCWELALGSCDSDDDCLGDLLCGTPPPLSLLPKGLGYEDRLHRTRRPRKFPRRCALPSPMSPRQRRRPMSP